MKLFLFVSMIVAFAFGCHVDSEEDEIGMSTISYITKDEDTRQNCDGASDEDLDGDGYTCSEGDCEDRNVDIHPGRHEICDDIDNDCDGLTDLDDDNLLIYSETCDGVDSDCDGEIDEDDDGDGFNCDDGDCNNLMSSVYPGADEICDGWDNDCDGDRDEDDDGDGWECFEDCDNTDPDVNPEAVEVPNDGIDNDCDGKVDER